MRCNADGKQLNRLFATESDLTQKSFFDDGDRNPAHANLDPVEQAQRRTLTRIYGVKAVLAKAFYELGITDEVLGHLQKRGESFQQINRLLTEMMSFSSSSERSMVN